MMNKYRTLSDATIADMELLNQARIRLISEGFVTLSVDMDTFIDIVFAQGDYSNTRADSVITEMKITI